MADFTPQMLRDLLASPDPKDQEFARQLADLEYANENARLANYPTPAPKSDQSWLNSKYIRGDIGPGRSGGMAIQDMPFPEPAAPASATPAPARRELVPNQFRNERTGEVTTLSSPAAEQPQEQILGQLQQKDGSIFQIVRVSTPTGMKETTRVVVPPGRGAFDKQDSEYALRQAQIENTKAQTEKAKLPPHYQPSIKDIIDPTDNSRMIAVDMNQYKGGGLGAPGVMGVSGKEPASAKRQEGMQAGLDSFNTIVSGLRNSYAALKSAGDISSSAKSAPENILNAVQSSGLGQFVGRAVGTKSQDERNTIDSARKILLQSIMQATGMTARQIDSNVELKAWMAAVTDPSRSYESNMKVLDNLENYVATRAAAVTDPNTRTGGATPAATAKPREVSFQDILAAAKKTGKDPLQVRKDAVAKGYVVRGM